MSVLSGLFLIILRAVSILIQLLNFLILVDVLLSWLPLGPDNRFAYYVHFITEPILGPCRRLLMRFEFFRNLPVDFSPILAWLVLIVLSMIVQQLYYLI